MIYTVTLNPSLDYYVKVDGFELGKTNRTDLELLVAGGKGINVSRVLLSLGLNSTALGFVAGFTGDVFVNQVKNMGIDTYFVNAADGMTRINVKMLSDDGTEINGMGPDISPVELNALLEKLGNLKSGDILVLAGSVPRSIPSNIYELIIKGLDCKGVKVIVDTYGESLGKVLKYRPFLVKPNKQELSEYFGVKLENNEQVMFYANKLVKAGAKNAIVSLGGDGAVFASESGENYYLQAPKGQLVNSVGAGDSMVAGFIYGIANNYKNEDAFKMAVAAGSASAFSKELANKTDILKLFEKL